MPSIRILLFGITREIVGSDSIELIVAEFATVAEIKQRMLMSYPPLRLLRSLTMAVNGVYADGDTVVTDNDEIAMIPPVSGG